MTPFASAGQAYAVTPSDSVDFTQGKCRGLYVGGAGNVVAIVGNAAVTFSAVPVGTTLWVEASRVNNTNTTATLMVALY